MHEGWLGDEYLVLFDESEASVASERYGVVDRLPGYSIVGLRGWDDFILRDSKGRLFTVPTVPFVARHLETFDAALNPDNLKPDKRLAGRIKWYVTPLAFGGDPQANQNIVWVDHTKHAELVRWWNGQFDTHRAANDA